MSNLPEFDFFYEKLLKFYNTYSLKGLSEATGIPITTISSIKQRKSISALKKKCMELNIFNEIFGSFSENVLTFSMNNIQKKLNIIETMIKDNKEIEDKFNEYLKGFIEDNL